jgi:outer membrane lipoprotein carrier protein
VINTPLGKRLHNLFTFLCQYPKRHKPLPSGFRVYFDEGKRMKILWITVLAVMALRAEVITLPEHFRANFTQTVTNPKNKTIHYSGKVAYSGNNLLKWSYVTPTKKEVCTDGKEVLVVDHDLEQTSAYRIDKGFDLTQILKKAKPYKPQIFVTEYEGKRYTIKVDSKGRLQSVAYYDDLDNKVQILFRNMRYGKGILPASEMKCNYPVEYDVIRG